MVNQEFILQRDIAATIIPAGEVVTLRAGTPVFVTQALGNSVTIRTERGLYRIAEADVDALGVDMAEWRRSLLPAAPGEFSENAVWNALRQCFDPEIPVNIVDLGLVYDLSIETGPDGRHRVEMKMTLTAQGCGMGPVIAEDARAKIFTLPGVAEARVHIVWDPVWNPAMISPEGRKILGLE